MGHDPTRIPPKSERIPNPIQQEHEHHSTHGHQEYLRSVQKWQHPVPFSLLKQADASMRSNVVHDS